MTNPRSLYIFLAAGALAFGCAGEAEPPDGSAAIDSTAGVSSPVPAIELNKDTLSAYERGMRREIEAVRAAQKRSSEANTPQQRGEAIQASFEQATIPHGAEAAGLDVARYRALRERVNDIFRTLDIQGKIDGPISMDMSRVDEATKQRLSRDPLADLGPASADALRAEMDRLVPVWVEYINLTAVAG